MQNPNLPPFIICDDENIDAKIATLDMLDRSGNPDPEYFSALYELVQRDLRSAQRAGKDYMDMYVQTEDHLIAISGFMSYLKAKHLDKNYA